MTPIDRIAPDYLPIISTYSDFGIELRLGLCDRSVAGTHCGNLRADIRPLLERIGHQFFDVVTQTYRDVLAIDALNRNGSVRGDTYSLVKSRLGIVNHGFSVLKIVDSLCLDLGGQQDLWVSRKTHLVPLLNRCQTRMRKCEIGLGSAHACVRGGEHEIGLLDVENYVLNCAVKGEVRGD